MAARLPDAVRRTAILVSSGAALMLSAACFRAAIPAPSALTVFASGDADLDGVARAASVVATHRSASPCLWVVCGRVETDPLIDGPDAAAVQVALFNAARPDAVLLDRSWLAYSQAGIRRLVDDARCHVLSAEVVDSLGETVAHPFLVRRSGSAQLGLTGLSVGDGGRQSGVSGVDYRSAEYAVRRTVPLIRRSVQTVALAVPAGDSCGDWGQDLTIGGIGDPATPHVRLPAGDSLIVFALPARGQIEGSVLGYAGAEPDSATWTVLDSVRSATRKVVGRVIGRLDGSLTADELLTAVMRTALDHGRDAFIDDGGLLRTGLPSGILTVGAVLQALAEPGPVVTAQLSSERLRRLVAVPGGRLSWRDGLGPNRIDREATFRVGMTSGFAVRHTLELTGGVTFEIDERPLWESVVEVIQSGRFAQ